MMSQTSAHAKAFTLTEMLIVIGIIIALLAIILPATMRAMRSGERARQMADLQTISVGLDEYFRDFQDYPRSSNITSGTAPAPYRGSHVLVEALLSPRDDDGAPGMGFRPRGTQGKIYGPYIKSEHFKYQYGPGTDSTYGTADDLVGELYDRAGVAIRYVPATTPKPNISVDTSRDYIDPSGNALYDTRYLKSGTNTDHELRCFKFLMGDANVDGEIDPGETPRTTAPYVLWAAGPDGSFGWTTTTYNSSEASRCDDVISYK